MNFRRLRGGEEDALLDLLGEWPLGEGWPARDFFARYVERDPTFDPGNVWVAEGAGRLVSCVQIFPRALRVRGAPVPTGGIGSVFTHPDWRKRGLAGELMRRAQGQMAEHGMALGLLFTMSHAFYEPLGWRRWPIRRPLLRASSQPQQVRGEPFDAAQDLAEVVAIHAEYTGRREGSALRDEAVWRASLELAGNPGEEFRVVRRNGTAVAYVRAITLSGLLFLCELGRQGDAADELAALVQEALAPRTDDALVPAGKTSAEFRAGAVASPLFDEELAAALERRGVRCELHEDPTAMFLCLDPEALARRTGLAPEPGESPHDLLRRVLPPERYGFWPADRF